MTLLSRRYRPIAPLPPPLRPSSLYDLPPHIIPAPPASITIAPHITPPPPPHISIASPVPLPNRPRTPPSPFLSAAPPAGPAPPTPPGACSDSAFIASLPTPDDPLIEVFDICTPLRADIWANALTALPNFSSSPYTNIASQIHHGFSLGLPDHVSQTFVPENDRMTPSEVLAVDEDVREAIASRRLAGPYTVAEVEGQIGPIHCNRLSTRAKYTPPGFPAKIRLIDNLSYPYDPSPSGVVSRNSLINKEDFPARWIRFRSLLDATRRFDPDAEVMVTDLTKAFCQLPLQPSQRLHHGIWWRGRVFFRKVPSFGGRSTPGVFCNMVDATLDLLEHHVDGIFATNCVDDLLFARSRRRDHITLDSIISFLNTLGWETSTDKTQPFGRRYKFMGVVFDLDEGTMELDKDKREKYALRIETFLQQGEAKATGVQLEAVLKLLGTLLYVAEIIPERRSKMIALLTLRKKYNNNRYLRLHTSRALRDELGDWLSLLRSPSPLKASFRLPPTISDHQFFTDAEPKALGVVIDNRTAERFLLTPAAAEAAARPGGIAAPEAWAVEAALAMVCKLEWTDTAVVCFCDNMVVVLGWRKGRSANALVNRSISRMQAICNERRILFHLEYIHTSLNPADAVSRGTIAPHLRPFPLPIPPPPGTQGGITG
ncbi:hypothetical protein JCM5296_004373 [Sporobolomyces johnsonii]